MSEARKRLEALAADLERLDPWGGTRSQSDAADLRELLAESDRLRSLVEEAGKVVERCQAVLAIMIKPDMTVSSLNAYTLCVEAEARARSILPKLKGEA